jgi:hypothetical protein
MTETVPANDPALRLGPCCSEVWATIGPEGSAAQQQLGGFALRKFVRDGDLTLGIVVKESQAWRDLAGDEDEDE